MAPKIDLWWMLRNWRFIAGAYWAAIHGRLTNYRGWLTLEGLCPRSPAEGRHLRQDREFWGKVARPLRSVAPDGR